MLSLLLGFNLPGFNKLLHLRYDLHMLVESEQSYDSDTFIPFQLLYHFQSLITSN